MSKRRFMHYRKDNGEVSHRDVIVVSEPRKTYLMYDISSLKLDEITYLLKTIEEADEYRNDCFAEFEAVTGIKQQSLWRSFKPEGIDWE